MVYIFMGLGEEKRVGKFSTYFVLIAGVNQSIPKALNLLSQSHEN